MKLLVVRHADAMSAADALRSNTDDFDRPLTPKGVRQIHEASERLARMVQAPKRIFHSPLLRAVQTAEVLGEAWPGAELVLCDALIPPVVGARILEALGDSGDTVLVGHEPELGKLAAWLMTGVAEPLFSFEKGGAALISFSGQPRQGAGKLRWLLPDAI